MNLRRLDDRGIDRFTDFLQSLKTDAPLPYPSALLTDPEATREVYPSITVDHRTFGNRFRVAEYLFGLFRDAGLTDVERDPGLWAWLSLFYFEELCPASRSGRRKPGEHARWILNPSGRRYYRHLLAGPFFVYRFHSDMPQRAIALLCGPLDEASDVYLELADSQQLVTNRAVIEAASRLYYDPPKGKLRRGTARAKPGGARRLAETLFQFDCTWDLYSMTAEDLLSLLPREFDKFKLAAEETLFDAFLVQG